MVCRWPGKNDVVGRVPTRVRYESGSSSLAGWGFGASRLKGKNIVESCFKHHLATNIRLQIAAPGCESFTYVGSDEIEDKKWDMDPSFDEFQMWFTYFLGALYKWVLPILAEKYPMFHERGTWVDYLFSIKAGWTPKVVRTFQGLVHRTGFGGALGHTATTYVLEPEAVAIYTIFLNREARDDVVPGYKVSIPRGNILTGSTVIQLLRCFYD